MKNLYYKTILPVQSGLTGRERTRQDKPFEIFIAIIASIFGSRQNRLQGYLVLSYI